MPHDPQWELQKAIYSTLTGNSAVMAIATGVHDHVDRGEGAPYIVIGEMNVQDSSSKSFLGTDIVVTIHTWDDVQRGMKTIRELMAAIVDALHNATLTLTGFTVPVASFEFSDTFVDPDGLTRHGVQQFRFLVCA